jgi:hypothetical protein
MRFPRIYHVAHVEWVRLGPLGPDSLGSGLSALASGPFAPGVQSLEAYGMVVRSKISCHHSGVAIYLSSIEGSSGSSWEAVVQAFLRIAVAVIAP